MKLKPFVLPACAVIFLLQLAVPAWMIIGREATLRLGKPFRFETAPVDPVDAFRGRYVAIQAKETSAETISGDQPIVPGQTVYVTLENDPAGYAKLATVSRERPAGGDYIRAKSGYGRTEVTLPLDRFYMNERLAPRAEQAYRESNRTEERKACIVVRVRRGNAVIEDLLLDGKPIREYLRESENN